MKFNFFSKLFIIIFILFYSINISFACKQVDTICLFNENPSSGGFQQLQNPTSADFQKLSNPSSLDFNKLSNPSIEDYGKLSNPSLKNFEKISDSASLDDFKKLTSSDRGNFFKKDISNINSKKDFFKDYLQNDLGLNVGDIKGNLKSFDGFTLEGKNQKIDISSIKNSNFGISVDFNGNLILKKGKGKIDFKGDVFTDRNGNLLIKLKKGSNFNAINIDFKTSKLNLKIIAPSHIDLGNGFLFDVKKGNFDFKITSFNSYDFIKSEILNKIYFDPKNKNLAASGCCLDLHRISKNGEIETVKIGKSSNKIGIGTLSKSEINVYGFTEFKLGLENFRTNEKDFLKDVVTGKFATNDKLSSDKSVTFFSKEDGTLMNVELNIGKKRNTAQFVNDVNSLMNKFIEDEIKSDPKILNQVKNDWNWILNNAQKFGLDKDKKIKKFMESFGKKITTENKNYLIPADVFINGITSIKKKIVNSKLSLSNLEVNTAISKMNSFTNLVGSKKVSVFLQTNLPKNKKYAVGSEIVTNYGLGELVKIGGKTIINADNVVFINTYNDGSSNIDFIATKNLAIPLNLGNSQRVLNTQYRFIVSIKNSNKNLDAKVIGIEVDNYNLNRIVANSDFSKVCAYLTSFNLEKCNN